MNWRVVTVGVSTCAALSARAAAPESHQSCDARVSELQRRVERGAGSGHADVLFTTEGIEPPTGGRGRPLDRSFIIVAHDRARTLIEGQPAGPGSAMARQIETVREQRRLLHPGGEGRDPVGLLVDRRTSARETVALARRLPETEDVWLLTQEAPRPPDPTLPGAVTEDLDALRRAPDWASRSTLANQLLARALAHCPGHERFFDAVHPEDADAERQLREAAAGAARNCSCAGVDVDAIEAVLLAVSEDPPAFHALRLKLRNKARDTLLLAPEATVEDLASRLPEKEVAVRWEQRPAAHIRKE